MSTNLDPDEPRAGRRTIKFAISLPSRVHLPGCTVGVSATSLAGMLADHRINAPAPVTWQLVVLVLGAMAYDVALRLVKRGR